MKQRPKNVTDKLAIQFFPEGGTLVKGISSRVAFKAESREDGNVILEGAIYTKDGEKLTEIKTLHDGMGIFTSYCWFFFGCISEYSRRKTSSS